VRAGLRLAIALLTVVPLTADRVDRETAGRAMLLAPAAGLIVGGGAAAVLLLGELAGLAAPPRAALAVAAMAVLTRALHLDGLADLADGLGSRRPAADVLVIMKRSDIGPFGVVTLALTLLIQVTALATAGEAAAAALIAAVTGRLTLPWACRPGVPCARPGGLGSLVAETVETRAVLVATAGVLVAAGSLGAVLDGVGGGVRALAAVLLGLVTALLTLRHARRRLGGITGDVLGALVELATTAALVALATH
jgi:adenosylcobinamide-GDP ribazoletransferase